MKAFFYTRARKDVPQAISHCDTRAQCDHVLPKDLLPPSNYISVHKARGKLEKKFSLDPLLNENFRDPLPSSACVQEVNQKRANLEMTASDGGINVDIYFHCRPGVDKQPTIPGLRALITATAANGPVVIKMHDCTRHHRPLVHIITSTTSEGTTLYLSALFHGPIYITAPNPTREPPTDPGTLNLPRTFNLRVPIVRVYTKVEFSDMVSPHMTVITEDSGSRIYFIGDPATFIPSTRIEEWRGDVASVSIACGGGRVKIAYIDETKIRGGFLSRLGKLYGFY